MNACIIIIGQMSNLALLVDCHKIITWLEDRKKLRKDWYNYLKAGEEKLKALLKDREWAIAYPQIHQYIAENQHNFNYNDIEKVVELLLQTDIAQQKSILFGYSDKKVKEWTTLLKYMQGNSLMLLSLAKFIQQSLRFDLPGLNKSIQSYDNQLTTLKRKIDFNNNTIFQQTKGLAKERSLLGIESEQKIPIEQLIESLVAKGPEQIKQLQSLVRSDTVRNLVNLYNRINEHNQTINPLSTLQYFMQNGDEFLQVYKDGSKKDIYSMTKKYRQFQHWKGSNQWQIEIQGQQQKHEDQIDHKTVIQTRQFRQKLMYDLNQLMFFFKGIAQELAGAQKGMGLDSEHQQSITMLQSQAELAINQIAKAVDFLTSKRLTAPLELKNSKKAYQLLVNQFRGYEANIAAMQLQISSYRQQILQLTQRREKQVEKLNQLRRKVCGCKGRCQTWLSELVKREVKITGEINKLQ